MFWGFSGGQADGASAGLRTPGSNGARVAVAASHIRSVILFVLMDALIVVTAYSIATVFYFRYRAPAHYWVHLALFLGVALVVQLVANRLFGLYSRMWRHAGIEEARQILLCSGLLDGVPHSVCTRSAGSFGLELVPIHVLVVGGLFATMGWEPCASTHACSPGSAARSGWVCGSG